MEIEYRNYNITISNFRGKWYAGVDTGTDFDLNLLLSCEGETKDSVIKKVKQNIDSHLDIEEESDRERNRLFDEE